MCWCSSASMIGLTLKYKQTYVKEVEQMFKGK